MVHTPGTVLYGRYEILEPIGSGGMGAVYKALDRQSDGVVAIKQMLEDGSGFDRPSLRDRFDKEWRTLRQLEHPRIPQMLDAFQEDNAGYYVMEYIQGRSLDQIVNELKKQGRRFPEVLLLEYTTQILDVLSYMHNLPKPLLHRDVKPQNIIVRDSDGELVLVDFGLVRNIESANTKTLVGTLGYAPLEQVKGHPEPRSDLYAVGATMFHVLTGEQPNPFDIPPIETVRNDLHPQLAEIVNRACQDNPNRRYASAEKMEFAVRQLLAVLKGESVNDERYGKLFAEQAEIVEHHPVAPVSTSAFFFNVVMGTGLVLSLLFGVAIVRNKLREKPKPPVASSTPVASKTKTPLDGLPPGLQPVSGQPDGYNLNPPGSITFTRPDPGLLNSLRGLGGPSWRLHAVNGNVSPGPVLQVAPSQSAGVWLERPSPAGITHATLSLIRDNGPASVDFRLLGGGGEIMLAIQSIYKEGMYVTALLSPATKQSASVQFPKTEINTTIELSAIAGNLEMEANGLKTSLSGLSLDKVKTVQLFLLPANQAQMVRVTQLNVI